MDVYGPLERVTVVGAFAGERDARCLVSVLSASPEIRAEYRLHELMGDRGPSHMVLLEVDAAGCDLERLQRAVLGCHGVVIPASYLPRRSRAERWTA